ncbi:hypothetical protein GGI43DRAFT_335994 [Trichoderma evansii]
MPKRTPSDQGSSRSKATEHRMLLKPKKKVESILSCVVVEEEGVAFWPASLQADGLLCEKMVDLEEQLKVVIAQHQIRA